MVRLYIGSILLASIAVKAATAAPPKRQSKGTATIDLNTNTGAATGLGAGFIYGFPDNGTEASSAIPDHFVTDIAFRASRAGGAQIPQKGWIGGVQAYVARFNSTLSNYRTTRKYGGDYILLPHDLWGSDGSAGVNALYPGDNGNWTETENFLNRVVQDLKSHDMLEGLVFDVWNEPDIDTFWARSWDQYVEYYVRATNIIRKLLPTTLISGPSAAHPPSLDDAKWKAWLSAIAKNKTIPDIYSWHQIGSWSREPDRVIPDFSTLLKNQGLPQRPIDINEYAALEEQNPANSAFYLAQLERHNLRGLRANWGSGQKLHDEMANLIYKGTSEYVANGDWQLYKYYAAMKGDKIATTASKDILFDVFATKQDRIVKIIAGTRTVKTAYDISIKGLTGLGLSADGNVNVQTYRFDWAGNRAKIGNPVNLGISSYKYSKDQLLITVNPPTNSTAFAYEIRY